MRHKKFVEYEELVLRRPAADRPRLLRYRSRAQPPLGITLCYGSFFGEPSPSDAADTNIFVAAVDPGSVASRDGRIRVGDQILQINGVSIHTRQNAIDQFTAPSELVRLLLARTPDDVNEIVKAPAIRIPTHVDPVLQKVSNSNPADHPNALVTTRCNSAAEKATDSGLSRGTDDSEGHDTPLPPVCSPPKSGDDDAMRIVLEEELEADLTHLHREMETIRLECERLYQRQARNNSARQLSAATTTNLTTSTPKPRECAFTPGAATAKLCRPAEAERTSARRQSAHLPLFAEETSSSAYNTGGDSCRSTPLKHDTACASSIAPAPLEDALRPRQLELRRVDTSENIYHTIDTPSTLVGDQQQKLAPLPTSLIVKEFRLPKLRIRDEWPSPPPRMRSKAPQNVENSAKKDERKERKKQKKSIDSNSPVENGEQLVETIAYQQRLLREAMIDEATILSSVAATSPLPTTNARRQSPPPDTAAATAGIPRPSCVPMLSNDADAKQNVQYEWKVRRRPDGTRYITRRPIRTQAMKAREEEVNRERFALSTDDDAASELKLGRFWSRDERKRHLERAKQRKLRHMKLIHEKARQAAAGEKEQLQLSRARQQRRNKHSLYDRFTTIQEVLAHGVPYVADDTTHGAARVMKVTTV